MSAAAAAISESHDLDCRPGATHDAQEVDRDHSIDDVVVLGSGIACAQDARIVDPDIGLDSPGKLTACGRVGDVQELVRTFDVGRDDMVAERSQSVYDRPAQAATRPRDDCRGHQM
jgi:hypothetical protein